VEGNQTIENVLNVQTQNCPSCELITYKDYYFCPNCGKQLRKKPLSTSIGKQIGLYLLSIFLPPFGIFPGIKYLLEKSGKAKMIGLVTIVLTIASVYVTTIAMIGVMNKFSQLLGTQSTLNQLQNVNIKNISY